MLTDDQIRNQLARLRHRCTLPELQSGDVFLHEEAIATISALWARLRESSVATKPEANEMSETNHDTQQAAPPQPLRGYWLERAAQICDYNICPSGCTCAAEIRAFADASLPTDQQKTPTMADAAEMLWVVLAGVSEGDWTKQTQEWQDAAARWRDNYFRALNEQQTPLRDEPTGNKSGG